jgi:hypothetical protein
MIINSRTRKINWDAHKLIRTPTLIIIIIIIIIKAMTYHKFQDYWRFIWLLILGPVRLIKLCAS